MELSCFSSASELAAALRAKQISAVETLRMHLAQCERHHRAINAICTLAADSAMTLAERADASAARGEWLGPLHGLPVSFKDSYETAGIRTTCGVPQLSDCVPQRDATVVTRIRHAGGIPFAKTNVPPWLSGFSTENEVFGRTNNPWSLGHSAGGSSGGSAAALAAGLTPLDIGSDMFGSIRVPAHFCGVAGIKGTQSRISRAGHYPPLPGWPSAGNSIAVAGPMARCVEDLLLTFPLLAGFDPADPDSIPMTLEASPQKPLTEYRLAWTDGFGSVPVSHETREVLARTAGMLEKSGVRVEKTSPPKLDFDRIWWAAGVICAGTLVFAMSQSERSGWEESLRETEKEGPLQAGSLCGVRGKLDDWSRAIEIKRDLIIQLRAFFASWDGWLLPTTCAPAFRQEDYRKPVLVNGHLLPASTAMGSYVTPFNLSGSPAVTFPAGRAETGLPIGLQLVGDFWNDMPLLRFAAAIEKQLGPFSIPPGF